jgi:hypothetical protein
MNNYALPPQPERGPGLKIAILFGIVIALLAANVYMFFQLGQVRTDVAKMRESILNEVSSVRETATLDTQTSRRQVETMRAELEGARRQAQMAAGQAKVDATKRAEELAAKLEESQRRVEQEVKREITEVQQTASAKIEGVSTEVGAVKKDVEASKAELDKTIENLKRVTGDLGVQSGLVATNGRELAALKALGDRNYFEFNIARSKQAMRIADITIQLKRADQKRNRYTIDLVADDKKFEKKDRTVNEPVQFYTSKYRQPYELVVNDVQKDRIVGYLSQPKVQATARTN